MKNTVSLISTALVARILPWILASLPLTARALPPAALDAQSRKPFVVVIDPGHGGADHGTVFNDGKSRVAEKDVTLALALQTAQQLRALGYVVKLTREADTDLTVPARTAYANRLRADLFISIHMNSMEPSGLGKAEGIETFILNNTTDASSRRLAELENSVLGDADRANPVQTDVALILKDLRLDANLSASKRLACAVQANLTAHNARSRGVRQALFYVLLGADMPSVLVEAGFLSSERDRARVLAEDGRKAIAASIGRAIDQYRGKYHASANGPRLSQIMSRCKIR